MRRFFLYIIMTLLLSVSCTPEHPAVYMLRPHEELPEEISRDDNVRITCDYYGVPLYNDLKSFLDTLE